MTGVIEVTLGVSFLSKDLHEELVLVQFRGTVDLLHRVNLRYDLRILDLRSLNIVLEMIRGLTL